MNVKLKWSIALTALLIVVGGFIPWSIGANHLRAELDQQTLRATGLTAAAHGAATIRMLPRPRVTFETVAIGDEDDAIHLKAPRLTADLRLAPLFLGRIQFSSVALTAPDVVVDPSGFRPEQGSVVARASNAPTATQEARKADRARLGAIYIVGGKAIIRGGAETIALEQIDAVVDWQSLGEPATLVGHLSWRGERAQVEALFGKPAELLRGERSPFTLKLASRALDLTLDGAIAGGARWLVEARLASSSDRLRLLLAKLELRPPLPGRLSRLALSGQLRALPHTMSLSDIKLMIDANSFDGSMALRLGGERPMLSGTLASRVLELGPNEVTPVAMRGHDRQWSRETITPPRFDLFDADMRLSVGKAKLGRLTLADAGMTMTVANGDLDLTVAGAEIYGGKLKGRFGLTPTPQGLDVRAAGGFANVDAGAFLRDVSRTPLVYGSATGDFQLQSSGPTVAALMQQLSGAARLSLTKGEIVGIDVEQAVRRAEKRPLSIPAQVRSGQTTFQHADVEANLERGLLTLQRASIQGAGVEMSIRGLVSIVDRSMRLDIAAAPPRPAATQVALNGETAMLNLDLIGSWEEPILTVDAESLIRRSPAAAPLLRRPAAVAPPVETP